MDAPIQRLAAEELPSFDDDAQRDIYQLLATADADLPAEAELREAA